VVPLGKRTKNDTAARKSDQNDEKKISALCSEMPARTGLRYG
jgi:hypothetical protein